MAGPSDGTIGNFHYITRPLTGRTRTTVAAPQGIRCAIFLPCGTLICYVGADSIAQRVSNMTARLEVQTGEGIAAFLEKRAAKFLT
jgi:hypothetical protein